MSGRPPLIAMATAVALGCLPAAARALATTGNDLRSQCTDYPGTIVEGLCSGFVIAIGEAVGQSYGVYGWRACFPTQTTRQQWVDVVKRYLDRHPEQRHLLAGFLVAKALAEAFPCKPVA